jgi:hypothetical protein
MAPRDCDEEVEARGYLRRAAESARSRCRRVTLAQVFAVALLLEALPGCVSLSQRVEKLVQSNQYAEARALLEDSGAGQTVAPKLSPDAAKARERYTEVVAERFIRDADSELRAGKARAACTLATQGSDLCPWSEQLTAAKVEHAQRVAQLDEILGQLRPLLQESQLLADDARRTFTLVGPIKKYTADTPELEALQSKARNSLAQSVADVIREHGRSLNEVELAAIKDDLALACEDNELREQLLEALSILAKLPARSSPEPLGAAAEQQVGELRDLVNAPRPASLATAAVAPGWNEVAGHFERFCTEDVAEFLRRADVSFSAVCLAEDLHAAVNSLHSADFEAALAQAHLTRAKQRSSEGKVAALTLLHLRRARELSATVSEADCQRIASLAQASLSGDLPVTMKIALDGDSRINPDAYDLMRVAIALQIIGRTGDHWKWQWVPAQQGKPAATIYLDSARLVATTFDELPEITSKYLSHYQDVPNPAKEAAERAVDMQEWQVAFAKSSYESAVSSHNIYPTQYSLMHANSCYNTYLTAVNMYNNLVVVYNATPSTISEPVFLPYTFRQGKMHFGWTAKATVSLGANRATVSEQAVDSDFVRVGSNYRDVNPEFRRDDPLDLDVGPERMVARLVSLASRLCDDFATALLQTPLDTRVELTDRERALLLGVLHPFRSTAKTLVLAPECAWAQQYVGSVELPKMTIAPPALAIKPPPGAPQAADPKALAAIYGGWVCSIESSFCHGSGVLISRDGLILTCGHVLLGSEQKARFSEGPLRGDYPLDIVFIQGQEDVALARARGLRSDSYAPVRLKLPATKGERIVAVGNPGLPGGTVNTGAISEGIVANPELAMDWGQNRLVADITVAQGSSGGPIIATDSGEVIGVITQIFEGGFRAAGDVSTSGMYCLAVPTAKLSQWVGLSYAE